MYYADHRDYGITYIGVVYAPENIRWNQEHSVQMWEDYDAARLAIDDEARAIGRRPCYEAEYQSNGESYGLCWYDRAPCVHSDAVGKMTGRIVGPFGSSLEALQAMPKNRTYGRQGW